MRYAPHTMSVGINPPKTPVTEGSNGVAAATLPNVCKMPGPPAPFVPTPLPNIGKSNNSPKGYSTSVKIEGNAVAIQGATFNSMGDVASQGTGGGIVSSNVQGPTSFIGPGSLDTKIEGKAVQLLSDQMLNNGGPSGSPANSATMGGLIQAMAAAVAANPENEDICGAGKHVERIQYPEVPKSEWHPQKRVDVLRSLAVTDGDMFEVAAAQHNVDDGSITHGSQLSRPLTPEEEAAGENGDSQKVFAICNVCGHRREIDHAPNKNSVVEAKSSDQAVRAGRQRANNSALVGRGLSVTYKTPPLSYAKYSALLDQGFGSVQIP